MSHKSIIRLFTLVFILILGVGQAFAAEEYGIFERILEASGSFHDTTTALEKAIAESKFTLQGKRDLTYADKQQQVRVYVLTSGDYMEAAKSEAPNTISAQILRIGVYQYGPGKPTQIDITNPVAHAMVFYSGSQNYDQLIAAAKAVEQELRDVVAKVPGKAVQEQLEPIRSESTLNEFDGDGPAKMMAVWRNWKESQNLMFSTTPEAFQATVDKVEKALHSSQDKGVGDSSGWTLVSEVKVRPDAVYFGISNDYTENKCIRINSDFRSRGKAPDAPYPGVDHAPALPLEILVYNNGKETKVVQYGEMWRMQLYFWDSGYLAFAKNTLIPSIIYSSIDDALKPVSAATTSP
ncbi:MAG: hypothetical protein ACYC9L_08545 [Sulfuricaulis sp.]